jgi:hypothetical protein
VTLLSALSNNASADEFTNAIRAFLQQRVEIEKRHVGVVIKMDETVRRRIDALYSR